MVDGARGNSGVSTLAENQMCSPLACQSRSTEYTDDGNPRSTQTVDQTASCGLGHLETILLGFGFSSPSRPFFYRGAGLSKAASARTFPVLSRGSHKNWPFLGALTSGRRQIEIAASCRIWGLHEFTSILRHDRLTVATAWRAPPSQLGNTTTLGCCHHYFNVT